MEHELSDTRGETEFCPDAIAREVLRARIRQVVRIHQMMFEKMLGRDAALSPEVAALFRAVGTTYLRIAEDLSGEDSSSRPGY